jgi:hypothetical protein
MKPRRDTIKNKNFRQKVGIKKFLLVKKEAISVLIYLWLYSPFVGTWPLFQFLNPIHSR